MPQNANSKGTRLTGINPLAYMGVEPSAPPQLVIFPNAPTNRDINFNLGTLWVVSNPFEVWMLINKTPQTPTKWILIYPQGDAGEATLFPTDAGTAEADAISHELNVLGGDNINTAAPGSSSTITVNLNEFITWPSTNAAGNTGVIYLDGDRFIHNYGAGGNADGNTFTGVESGSFSLTGLGNTGYGAATLQDITNGDQNTAVGLSSLSTITTGSGNIGLGFNAGSSLSAGDSNNIAIGNAANPGDSDTIRIGETQTATYVSGIYNTTVAGTPTPNTVVNVDDQGQLGQLEFTSLDNSITFTQTDNGHLDFSVVQGGAGGALTQANFGTVFSQPFFYHQATSSGDLSGTPATYTLGATVPLTQLYDTNNNMTTGGVFTAPATGKYVFNVNIALTATTNGYTIQVVTTTRTYSFITYTTGSGSCGGGFSVIADMNATNTATFLITRPGGGNFPSATIVLGTNSTPPFTNYVTSVSGYRIA